jgi:hypothetical protein
LTAPHALRYGPAIVPRTILAPLVALGLGAAVAGAVTFGSDLAGPANNQATCGALQSPSCMFFSAAPGPTFYAPLSGTITAVRVKTGNFVQGPMQVVVMRSLFQNSADPGHPYFACCFVQQYGPIFTPAPNAVTTVPTQLPVVEDPVPPPDDLIDNARGDFLALSVLVPNVPVPAFFDGQSFFDGFAPAPDPQTTPAPSPNPIFATTGGSGYQVLMNADLDVGGGGGDVPPVAIATGGQLLGTTAAVPLVCALTSVCNGVLRLTDPAAALRAAGAKPKVYGKRRFKIAAGATESVRIRLNAAGRKKLRGLSTVVLEATAKVGSRVVSSGVQLTRH